MLVVEGLFHENNNYQLYGRYGNIFNDRSTGKGSA